MSDSGSFDNLAIELQVQFFLLFLTRSDTTVVDSDYFHRRANLNIKKCS